jgi:hypothetical protein
MTPIQCKALRAQLKCSIPYGPKDLPGWCGSQGMALTQEAATGDWVVIKAGVVVARTK